MDHTVEALLNSLTVQRNHVTGILQGLSDQELHRPALPTGWSCLGLVHHLALDVERFWFRTVMAGEVTTPAETQSDRSAWEVEPSTPPEVVFARYRSEIEQANRIISATPLEAEPAAWPAEQFGDFRLADLRAILLHVITETACHAGHLDAARELLDGHTWLVL